MNYIDANIFIYPLVNPINDEKLLLSNKILSQIVNNKLNSYTSYLTWDEFMHVLVKKLGKEEAIKEGEKFLRFPNLVFLKADGNVIFRAQELISKYNLKPRDAIHVATALINGINHIISDDSDFDKITELKRIKLD